MAKENIGRLTYLTEKIVNEEPLSAEEAAELETFLSSNPRFRSEYQRRIDRPQLDSTMAVFIRAKTNWRNRFDAVLSRGKISRFRQRSIPLWQYYSASAAILIFLVAGLVIVVGRHKKVRETPVVSKVQDIKPGGNRAILTLADGSSVVLDSARNGLLAQQGRSKIVKLANGQLEYKTEDKSGDASGERDRAIAYNTVSTPAGGTYQVNLPDGSKVWLNAVSSIRFPTSFADTRRDVEITGEVYFEVARIANRPFHAKTRNLDITVLGTSYDVMAYDDEKTVNVSLNDGSVKVSNGSRSTVLEKGDQARADSAGNIRVVKDIDIKQAVAWTRGEMDFTGSDIGTIMRTISRWYDVDIRYETQKDSHTFTGQISRDSKASEALQILSTSGYHFKIQGNTITVLP